MSKSPSPLKIPSVPKVSQLAPQGGQSWGSYWTVVTAMGVVMLILYLAANGQLSSWLALFVFSIPTTVQPQGAAPSTTGSVATPGNNNAVQTTNQTATANANIFGLFGQMLGLTNPLGTSGTSTPATTPGGSSGSASGGNT